MKYHINEKTHRERAIRHSVKQEKVIDEQSVRKAQVANTSL